LEVGLAEKKFICGIIPAGKAFQFPDLDSARMVHSSHIKAHKIDSKTICSFLIKKNIV